MANESTRTNLIRRTFIEMMKDVNTSVPGHIVSFDPDTQLAQIQIGVKGVALSGQTFDHGVLIECVVCVYGTDFTCEVEINPGDEGAIFFSQRCIEAWVNTGGIAENPIIRFHDINDAYFLPGIRSQPNVISGHQNNGIRLRNKAGDRFVWLKNDGTAQIDVTTLNINGDIVHNGNTMQTGDIIHEGNNVQVGNLTQTGTYTLTGAATSSVSFTAPTVIGTVDITFGGLSGLGHRHSSGTGSDGNTGSSIP